MEYGEFLSGKAVKADETGFDISLDELNDRRFNPYVNTFQQSL